MPRPTSAQPTDIPSNVTPPIIRVRPYRADAWEAACEIYNLGKPDELRGLVDPGAIPPLQADREMKSLFDASRIVVMEAADRVIGFAGSRGSHITSLFVHPDFRRKGVATALVRDMLSRLGPPVTLNVAIGNASARALYERVGFKNEQEFLGEFQGVRCRVARLRYEATLPASRYSVPVQDSGPRLNLTVMNRIRALGKGAR